MKVPMHWLVGVSGRHVSPFQIVVLMIQWKLEGEPIIERSTDALTWFPLILVGTDVMVGLPPEAIGVLSIR